MPLIYQLDALAASSLWADDAKTTPASDGGVVAVWSPNSFSSVTTDAIQTSNTKRPLYRSNYSSSGYPAIEFDGSNDELQCAHSASFSASVYDVFLVVTPVAVGGGDKLILAKFTNSSWNDGVNINHAGSLIRAGAPDYAQVTASDALVNGVKSLIAVKLKVSDRTLFSVRSDNLVIPVRSTSAAAVSTPSTAALCFGGSTPAGGYYSNMAWHEVRIYTGELSLSDRLSVFATLADKWGLTTLSGGTARPSHPMYQQVIG